MKTIALAFVLLAAPPLLAQSWDLQPVVLDPSPDQVAYNVRLAITQESLLSSEGVYIDESVDQDHFVTLTGVVPDAVARAFAERRISEVPGVRWVTNNLKIGELRIVPGQGTASPQR